MDVTEFAESTAMTRSSFARAGKLVTLMVVAFMVLLITAITTGVLLHTEVMGTYHDNYAALEQAGFSDIIASPSVVDERIVLIISIIPLLGAGLFFPILYFSAIQIEGILDEAAKYRKLRSSLNKMRTDDSTTVAVVRDIIDYRREINRLCRS